MSFDEMRVQLRRGLDSDPDHCRCWVLSCNVRAYCDPHDPGTEQLVELRIRVGGQFDGGEDVQAWSCDRSIRDDICILPRAEIEERVLSAEACGAFEEFLDDAGTVPNWSDTTMAEMRAQFFAIEELKESEAGQRVLAAIDEMRLRWRMLRRIVAPHTTV